MSARIAVIGRPLAHGDLSMSRLLPSVIIALLPVMTALSETAQAQPNRVAVAPAARADDGLRPGDAIRLRIWREPDLSGDFTIDENGVVTLPKIGPMRAAGEPVDSLKRSLLEQYRVYLNEPSIEVVPLRRIQVAGAVRVPGLFTIDPTMTVADVVALAGGVTPDGQFDRVMLVRAGRTVTERLPPETRAVQLALQSGDELFVPERSWLRNPNVVIGAVSAAASLIWALSRFNP